MVDQLGSFASEVTRVAKEVGTEGKLGGHAEVKGVTGAWRDLTDNVNQLAGNLTVQLRDVSRVATAIANGDLTQKITVEVRGEILQIKEVFNKMVDQLGAFASEVTLPASASRRNSCPSSSTASPRRMARQTGATAVSAWAWRSCAT
jgi:HAMP domain-containing protein